MNHLVAVYGSLRRGFGNYPIIKDAPFQGTTHIGGFFMISLGFFPGVIKTEDETSHIFAETYLVNDKELERLDRLEGHPTFYTRTKVHTVYGEAWIYVLPPEPNYLTQCARVDSGDWAKYQDEKRKQRMDASTVREVQANG